MNNDRNALIAGLIALAGFLKANPQVPTSIAPVIIRGFPSNDTDEQMCAEVDKVAALLGTDIDRDHLPHGHYMTSISFGPVTYEFTAILATARARHAAVDSYRDCIQTDI
ncbi:unnamed protein product [[Actinomadura] parvosata subsp. kistnae]|uniref:Uncharacterized protein n=1 Tax=[Actinomadura] parvosata subsp. kistnae TaxID=1909395 RepID=A0A1V0AED6_9ACTN|nr:hypothetical protein [Nonomuraea sp. ATCC 55076]AQZ68591.1 hypothetical protein BKM31_50310 [Nonomuraea sp. ATCC 55076]SPL92940.1 unnamed protein product [Actinomadura parvosata subsp. kistnae]